VKPPRGTVHMIVMAISQKVVEWAINDSYLFCSLAFTRHDDYLVTCNYRINTALVWISRALFNS
jgi:hypothetical protein